MQMHWIGDVTCQLAAFMAPPVVASRSRVSTIQASETSWRRSYDGKGGVAVASSGGMTVAEACKFMADPSLASASVADKNAFLASKGVDAFVIAQSECVEQGAGAITEVSFTASVEHPGEHHVLDRRHRCEQIELLEDDAYLEEDEKLAAADAGYTGGHHNKDHHKGPQEGAT